MTAVVITLQNMMPMVASSFFYFTKARFFAGLFCRGQKLNLSGA